MNTTKHLIDEVADGKDPDEAIAESISGDELADLVYKLRMALPHDVQGVAIKGDSNFGVVSVTLRYPTFERGDKEAPNNIWHNHPKATLVQLYPKQGKIQAKLLMTNTKNKMKGKTGPTDQIVKYVAAYFKSIM